jgi:hypothetical protein
MNASSSSSAFALLQIARVEAFGKPTVDRSEKIAGLIPLALIAPEPRFLSDLAFVRSRLGARRAFG